VPVNGCVLGQQLLTELTRGHVPTGFAPVDEHGATSPTVRQRVVVVESTKERAATFQFVVDGVVGFAYVLALEPRDLRGEFPVGPDGLRVGRP